MRGNLYKIHLLSKNVPIELFHGNNILVTGGAGFIGSWICDALIRLGSSVTCIDNLSTGRMRNIQHLRAFRNFSFINADVNAYNITRRYDMIIHCASIPSPDDYMRRPLESMLPNSVGLLNLLEAARRDDSIILFMSSSEVYGSANVIPTPEDYWGYVNPIGPRSCYDESKRFGEALCMAYYRQYGVDVRIARIFNTYGPRMDLEARYARVIPRFIIQALRGEPITIHGDGLQTRSFCYITDTVMALLKMLIVDKCRGEVVNIGSPHETTILELAKTIKRLTGSNSPLKFVEPRPDDPRRRCPDITKARRLLGWEPKVPLEEGLKCTIEWFKTELGYR